MKKKSGKSKATAIAAAVRGLGTPPRKSFASLLQRVGSMAASVGGKTLAAAKRIVASTTATVRQHQKRKAKGQVSALAGLADGHKRKLKRQVDHLVASQVHTSLMGGDGRKKFNAASAMRNLQEYAKVTSALKIPSKPKKKTVAKPKAKTPSKKKMPANVIPMRAGVLSGIAAVARKKNKVAAKTKVTRVKKPAKSAKGSKTKKPKRRAA